MLVREQLRRTFQFNQVERDYWIAGWASRIPGGQKVIDVGAGAGPYRELFSHCEYRAHDFAGEPSTIGHYTDLHYVSDITHIPAADGEFDVVICTEVLEHVPEPIKAVAEIARILRPGGLLLLTAPLGCQLHQQPYIFYGGYTPYWYDKFLPSAGFCEVRVERNRGFFSMFGQEAQRFSAFLDPRRTSRRPLTTRIALSLIWLMTLFGCRVLYPLLGRWFDSLQLESEGTVGYHVSARRAPTSPGR